MYTSIYLLKTFYSIIILYIITLIFTYPILSNIHVFIFTLFTTFIIIHYATIFLLYTDFIYIQFFCVVHLYNLYICCILFYSQFIPTYGFTFYFYSFCFVTSYCLLFYYPINFKYSAENFRMFPITLFY